MNKCTRCKKDKSCELFLDNNKEFKTCIDCRNKSRKWSDNWYKNNKEIVSL